MAEIGVHHLHLIARFFDFIFAGGFAFLSVMFTIQGATYDRVEYFGNVYSEWT